MYDPVDRLEEIESVTKHMYLVNELPVKPFVFFFVKYWSLYQDSHLWFCFCGLSLIFFWIELWNI